VRADAIGDRYHSRQCRLTLGWAQLWQGDLAGAVAQLGELVAEDATAHEDMLKLAILQGLGLCPRIPG